MRTAVAVMDSVLRDDFGFGHVAWVYSGRRGIHAWVCDPAARELTDAARAAVASYCEVRICVFVYECVYICIGVCMC
jgi:DNA primase small subunit